MTVRDFMVNVGVKVDEDSVKTAESTVNNLKGTLSKVLKVIGISFSLTSINSLLEEWNDVNKVLNRVNTNLGSAQEVQDKILESANACRMAYSDMADYVNDLVRNGSNFFSTAEDAADFLTTANQLFYVSGATESEISSLNKAITNTFTKGKMSASDFNTMLSACPEIVTLLADSLGVTEQQVKALGTSGNITAKQLKSALTSAADDIAEAYDGMSLTISDAIQIIKNEWGTWLSQMDQTYNFTDSIARALVSAFEWLMGVLKQLTSMWDRLVDFMGSAKGALEALVAVAGSLYVAFHFDKIMTGLKSLKNMFSGIGGKVMLVVLAIVALILIIDDLVAFVNGDASVIGTLFDSAGISADGMKESLSALFDSVMTLVKALGNALLPLLDSMSEIIAEILELVSELITVVADALVVVIDLCSDSLLNLADRIGGVLDMFSGLLEFVTGVFTLDFSKALQGLADMGCALGNSFISAGEGIVNFFIGFVNGIIKVINFVRGLFGAESYDLIEKVSWERLEKIDVTDYFANGAYVEANKPQLAVVGDNKYEGEYIAPESKLRDAVAQAMDMEILNGMAALAAGYGRRTAVAGFGTLTDNSSTRIYQEIYMDNTFNQNDRSVQKETSEAMSTSADELVKTLADTLKFA